MRALLLSSLSLAFIATLVACPPGGGPGDGSSEGEGEVEIVDAGLGEEGEGEEGEGEEGEGEGEGEEGEGEGEVVQGEPYSGLPEPGPRCGGVTCDQAPNTTCCVGQAGPVCGVNDQCGLALEINCDGPEDCNVGAGEECCAQGFAGAQCVATNTCREGGGQEICVTDADCLPTELCCSDEALAQFGLDGGVCLPAEQNCAGTVPGGN